MSSKGASPCGAMDMLGNIYAKQEKTELAMEVFDKAISTCPDYAHTYFDRGSMYLISGEYSKALEDLRRAVKLDPDYPEFNMALGAGLVNLGEYTEAIHYLEKAIALDSFLTPARSYLAIAYMNTEQWALADRQFDWILKNDPTSEGAKLILQEPVP